MALSLTSTRDAVVEDSMHLCDQYKIVFLYIVHFYIASLYNVKGVGVSGNRFIFIIK